MIHLFIDTNAYLTFYHLTSDDLEELKKLLLLVKQKKELTLHLPEQTFDEFNRNRDVKIADALKRFKEEKLTNQFPQMTKEYPEYIKIRDAIKDFDYNKSKLLEKLYDDISKNQLAADKIIQELFKLAEFYNSTDELIAKSKTRFDLGKPPGKGKSYGDALIWETLLTNIPDWEDLYFISDDKDYFSEINNNDFNKYLFSEWSHSKSSEVISYRRISEFFQNHFPKIKIASEYEKEILIEELGVKKSFAGARSTLRKISKFEDFSAEQINDFLLSCVNNNQVHWIQEDADIEEMIKKIIAPNLSKADSTVLEEFKKVFHYKI